MVLNSLGAQLSAALGKLTKSASVDEETVKAVLNDVVRALLDADVNFALVTKLKQAVNARINLEDDAAGVNRARIIERAVVEELVKMLDPGREAFKPKKGKANVVMFVGLQGAGKTTTVAKYAHYYQSRKWRVAMVCADTFRAGAFDQLKQNATRVRVPFYGSYTEADPVKIAREGVEAFKKEGYDVIIVDTSGRHKQEAGLFEEMQQVAAAVKPDDVVFVMDGSIGQAAQAQAAAFKATVPVGSVIITKLDGHAKGGGALSAVAATGSPIVFLGTGEHFDDLAPFDASRFIGKLLGKGDLGGLVNEFKEKGILDAQGELMERIGKGKFTMRDFREQISQLMKLGSIGKIMEMMPGGMGQLFAQMQAQAGGQGGPDPGTQRFKGFLVMMDSMTAEELDGEVEITDSRAIRIIRGCGCHPQEFRMLLDMFKQFEKMIGGFNKSGLLRNDAALSKQMKRDPKAVMAHLQKAVDPRMLAQMGGAQNLMQLMQAMEDGEGPMAGGAKKGKGGKGGVAAGGMPPGFPGMPPGFPGMGGGGFPGMPPGMDMAGMMKAVQQMMGGGRR